MLEAQTLHPSELSALHRKEWEALRAAHPAFTNPLLGPDFAQAVGAKRDDARVSVLKRDSQTVGFLAYHRRPGGMIRPIGAPLSDYHAIISAGPIDVAEALAAIGVSALRYFGLIDPWKSFDAPEATKDSYLIELTGGAEPYLEALRAASAKKFKNWRRLDHKLDRDVAPLRLVAPDTSEAAFNALLTWKSEQLRRTGGHDFLASSWTRALFDDLFARREGNFQGLMVCLYAGDQLVAGHFGVREGDYYHPWIASADPALTAYSPGQVFLTRAIAAMPELGLTRYDLGPGHDHYKRAYAQTVIQIASGMAAAPTAAGRTAQGVDQMWAMAGARGDGFTARLRRRLDIIASTELTLIGRTRGLADAVAGQARRRLAPAEAE